MATAPRPSTADLLELYAGALHAAAFDSREPAMTIAAVERRIAEVERICAAARAAVRGG